MPINRFEKIAAGVMGAGAVTLGIIKIFGPRAGTEHELLQEFILTDLAKIVTDYTYVPPKPEITSLPPSFSDHLSFVEKLEKQACAPKGLLGRG
jgi:hypothetical protein